MIRRINKKGGNFGDALMVWAFLALLISLLVWGIFAVWEAKGENIANCERVAFETLNEPFVCTYSNPHHKEYVCTCWQEISYGEMITRNNYVSFYITKPSISQGIFN